MVKYNTISQHILPKFIADNPAVNELSTILIELPPQEREDITKMIVQFGMSIDLNSGLSTPRSIVPASVVSANQILTTSLSEPDMSVLGLNPVGMTILTSTLKVGKSWLGLQMKRVIEGSGVVFGQKEVNYRISIKQNIQATNYYKKQKLLKIKIYEE